MKIEIDATSLNIVTEKLRSLDFRKAIRAGLRAGAIQLAGHFRDDYPPVNRPSRKSVYGQSFKSDKQRRYVMAMIRRGEIPYVRGSAGKSERLGERWTTEMRDDTTAVIGNSASYAGLVMAPGVQTKYMAAVGWHTVDTIATAKKAEIIETIEGATMDVLREAGL